MHYTVVRDLVVGDLGTLLLPGAQVHFDGTWVRFGNQRARCVALRRAIDSGYLVESTEQVL